MFGKNKIYILGNKYNNRSSPYYFYTLQKEKKAPFSKDSLTNESNIACKIFYT